MKKHLLFFFLFFSLTGFIRTYSQEASTQLEKEPLTKLFKSSELLTLNMQYSNRDLKNKTNDSTYIKTLLTYLNKDKHWDSLKLEIRSRGNFRKNNCYYTPVKLSIKKKDAKSTLFKGNKKLKLVMPCKTDKFAHDYILKEYLAYKFYEIISPYSFSTRLVDLNFDELRGKKIRNHQIRAFLVEDDKNVAKRAGGKILESKVHPLEQDAQNCVRHDFFQYMIGNIDFSSTFQHNAELLYVEGKIFPVPYDFDMSGLVNTNYSDMLAPQLAKMNMNSVTTRNYRGFVHHIDIFKSVREEYLSKKQEILNSIDAVAPYFKSKNQVDEVEAYIRSFYKILENDSEFIDRIVTKARTN